MTRRELNEEEVAAWRALRPPRSEKSADRERLKREEQEWDEKQARLEEFRRTGRDPILGELRP